ncbi:MAG: ergothioneine biosynthesis protein EgtB [Flavobacterium sp.]|nr:MAG: ergothioneine biosynthesis protein EgtB [Flavobacterium sp.]
MNLLSKYQKIRRQTGLICAPLQIEDYVPQPVIFVSPPKWHLAHSTWFFEQFILRQHVRDYVDFNADFNFLFNSYYNNVGDRVLRADRGNLTRPSVADIYQYRKHVDRFMEEFLGKDPTDDVRKLIELGLNHEQQHQELLMTDIKYILGNNPTFPPYNPNIKWEQQRNDSEGYVTLHEGVYEIGSDGETFCFDNELSRHKIYLNSFEISDALVTNGEFLEFMESGGYRNFNLWLDEGWSWINENRICSPMYWHQINGNWHSYTLAGLREIDPQALVTHISFYEAAAYAEFRGMRLPTEAEWEVASTKFSWGSRWEWTNSAYLPYPGYQKTEGAIGEYNGKFMINQMVLRGSSCATPAGHSRNSYRNFFHPEERWQFNGIRLVKK